MKNNTAWVLTVATIKMYFRDRAALFWAFALPILIMAIFGVLNFGSFGSVDLGVVDTADNDASRRFLESLEPIEALELSLGAMEQERQALMDGDRDLVMVLPQGFGAGDVAVEVKVLYNEGRPAEVQVGQTIVRGSHQRDDPGDFGNATPFHHGVGAGYGTGMSATSISCCRVSSPCQ